MKTQSSFLKRGFTLLETVIAIGVLAVLLTGFIIVFAPAAAGIKKAINVQEADRLASTVEQEMVKWRTGDFGTTGFEKAFNWIEKSNAGSADDALLVYQYRGDPDSPRTDDGTPTPVEDASGNVPGVGYIVQSMVRRKSDSKFLEDLKAVEGGVYLVKCTQLVFDSAGGGLKTGTPGKIIDPKGTTAFTSANGPPIFPEAVIAFSAEFFNVPARNASYFSGKFSDFYSKAKSPVFTRNLAVRR